MKWLAKALAVLALLWLLIALQQGLQGAVDASGTPAQAIFACMKAVSKGDRETREDWTWMYPAS